MNLAVLSVYHQFHFEVLAKLICHEEYKFKYASYSTIKNVHGEHTVIKTIWDELKDKIKIHNKLEEEVFFDDFCNIGDIPYLVDDKLLEEFKYVENMAFMLMDRHSLPGVSMLYKKRLYLKQLNYCLNIITSGHIDCAIAFDSPHSSYPFIFQQLMIYLGKHFVCLEHHTLPGYCTILHNGRFQKLPNVDVNKLDVNSLNERLPEEIKTALTTKNRFLDFYKSKETKRLIVGNRLGCIKLWLRFILKLTTNIIQGALPWFFKREILHFTAYHRIYNRFIYRLKLTPSIYILTKLNILYNKIAVKPDYKAPYVFFGLHMQPEKTSQPHGKDYDQQLKAIWMLAQALPEGWLLYVKEHPNQFNLKRANNSLYRSREFYEDIQSLKNVKLIALSEPSELLLEKSKIAATLTGTLGWEALLIGKPVIAFGLSYYQECPAVFKPTSVQEIKDIFSKLPFIDNEYVLKALYWYLSEYSSKGQLIKAANWEVKFEFHDENRSQQIQTLADAFSIRLNELAHNG